MEPNPSIPEILESDHRALDDLLSSTFEAIGSSNAALTFERLDLFWARLAMHIRSEHLRVFPAVKMLSESLGTADEIGTILDDLRHDHDLFMREIARAIKALRLVFDFGNERETLAVVQGLLETVRNRLEIHNQIEEEKVYRFATERFLDPAAVETLYLGVQKELQNMPPRFGTAKPMEA